MKVKLVWSDGRGRRKCYAVAMGQGFGKWGRSTRAAKAAVRAAAREGATN